MKTYLVTGAAGFIGANYIKYILAKHEDIKVVILDALTYAGNLGTIAKDVDNERCFFIKGNICDRELADRLFSEYKFDYIVNFAAESHVDRSIENPQLFLRLISWELKTCWMQPAVHGLPEKTKTVILHGEKMYAIIRYQPTKYMVRWVKKASSLKKLLYARTAHTVRQRPVPI